MAAGTKNTKHLVRSQLPEFVVEDYPKFVEFLQAYYTFVTENYNVQIESLRDPDNTAQKLLIFLRRELLKNFPNSVIDERKLLMMIRQVYARKGNADGISLLFKLFFNEAIIIRQPGEKILKASDARWIQSNIITLAQIDWDKVVVAVARAAAGAEPEATLFNTVIGGWKVGDIDLSGTVEHSDSTYIAKYSLNPLNVNDTMRARIEDYLIPAIMSNPIFADQDYLYSTLNPAEIIPEVSRIIIENDYGRFTPTISEFDFETNKKIRLFYNTNRSVQVKSGQMISITGADGSVIFTGRHAKSPDGIQILTPGTNWQRGQVITIPGSIKDSVGRVVEVDENFGIKRVEILEHGGSHDENQAVVISPYPTKPVESSSWNREDEVTGVNGAGVPNAFHITISIEDYVENAYDELYGDKYTTNFGNLSNEILNAASGVEPAATLFNLVYSGQKIGDVDENGLILAADARLVDLYAADPDSVSPAVKTHIEDILLEKLNLQSLFIQNFPPVTPYNYTGILYSIITPAIPVISVTTSETYSVKYNFSELTMSEWLASRATLYFTRADIVRTKGKYLNDQSQISNTESRLQDNYFYQLFSYLIETTQSGDDVTYILNQFHPAGMKYFFQLFKQATFSVRDLVEAYRAFSNDVVFALDVIASSDPYLAKEVTKPLEDFPVPSDAWEKLFIKAVFDLYDGVDTNSTIVSDWYLPGDFAKDFIKVIHNGHYAGDINDTAMSDWHLANDFAKVATKPLTDTSALAEAEIKNATKVLDDISVGTDLYAGIINKPILNDPSDAIAIDGGTFDSFTSTGYADDYFGEYFSELSLDVVIL